MKVNHIGYLVKSIKKSQKEFESLGYKVISDIVFDPIRGIDICFLKNENTVIELVQPKLKDSVVYELSKKYKNSPYHICYEVENIEYSIEELLNTGKWIQIQELEIAPAFNNKRVCFFMNPNIGMIELVEK